MVGSLELFDVKSPGVAMTSVTIYVYAILHGANMQECFHACATFTLRLCELVGHRLSCRTFGNSFCPRVACVRELFVNALVLQVCCRPGACFVFFSFVCPCACVCVFCLRGFPWIVVFSHGVSGVKLVLLFCVGICVCVFACGCVRLSTGWVCCGVCIGVVGGVCLCLCLCCICVIVFGVFACVCMYAFFVRVFVVGLV